MKIMLVFLPVVLVGGVVSLWVAGVVPPLAAPKDPVLQPAGDAGASQGGRVIRGLGFVEPITEVRKLNFKIDGIIETCPFQVGQGVEAGTVLATLQNHDEKSAVLVAEKELLVARAECAKLLSGIHPRQIESAKRRVAKLQERVRHAQQERDRQARLFERKAVTEEAFDLANTALHQAKEEFLEGQADLDHLETNVRAEDKALAEARVELADANLITAKERLSNTVLVAPFTGTVLEIFQREGDAIRPYDPQPVMLFADSANLRVRAEIDERYATQIRVGQSAIIRDRGMNHRTFEGRVVLVKGIMGTKTVFSRDAAERKDLDVVQVFVEADGLRDMPIGLKVDVDLLPEQENVTSAR